MHNKDDNFRTRRDDGDNLGKKDHEHKVSENPAPKGTDPDRESETTPPENEVYVDIEPDELHLSDEDDLEEIDVRE
ncbi:hypothetical protein [Pontibacter sp. SGAir0037]|uniref:hypothetical protein n=1 Tax=Pontibacter sp. SGAir0037 TaxID=2571030 RepID=UPI0010CCED57|nr:hypothetical protein [Pontibacter sp. SGAir0037]QCR23286.1 hypothetical protein C1N53_13695 [Pontibacter sp. SGAir0037]